MPLKYSLPKGRRYKRGKIFHTCTTFDGYWWSYKYKRWLHNNDPLLKGPYANHAPFYFQSTKAFRRRVKEWSRYLPEGVEFILPGRYTEVGDITARTSTKRKFYF